MNRILLVNLGGTSTKLAIFDDEMLLVEGTIRHTDEEIQACDTNEKQVSFRKKMITNWLDESPYSLESINAIVIRSSGAGMCKRGGTYLVTGRLRDGMMEAYKKSFPLAGHPSFYVLPLVEEVIGDLDIPVYIVDPDGVDEFNDVARVPVVFMY